MRGEKLKNFLKKSNVRLLLICLFLSGLGYIGIYGLPWQKSLVIFGDIQTDEVSRIEITEAEKDPVVLSRVEASDSWQIASNQNFPAKKARVDDILRNTIELSREELISSNPENQKSLQVSESTGTRVTLFIGEKEVADYWVGKIGSNFLSTYFRVEGEKEVYLSSRVLTSVVSPLDWRDLTVMDFDTSQVKWVQIRGDEEVFKLNKFADEWSFEDGTLADYDAVQDLIFNLKSLTADDISVVEDLVSVGMTDSSQNYILSFETDLGNELLEVLLGEENGQGLVPVKTNQSVFVYWVSPEFLKEYPQTKSDLTVIE